MKRSAYWLRKNALSKMFSEVSFDWTFNGIFMICYLAQGSYSKEMTFFGNTLIVVSEKTPPELEKSKFRTTFLKLSPASM